MAGLQNTAHELADEGELLDKQHDATARMVKSLDKQLVAITDEVKDDRESEHLRARGGNEARSTPAASDRDLQARPLYSAEVLFSAQRSDSSSRDTSTAPAGSPRQGLVHRLEDLHNRIESQHTQLVGASSVIENRGRKSVRPRGWSSWRSCDA